MSRSSEANRDVQITFYGDDLTGSTDVMESLTLNGMRTVLFFEPPHPDDLAEFDEVDAVGVAGRSRAMTPTEMDDALPSIFEQLRRFDAELFHYKVCSTFDSGPNIGSIGHAIDLGMDIFGSEAVPIVVAAPDLHPRGRYVAFGNLFASVDGTVYRLDRHPTMKDHPITPMDEADVRKHLAKQTEAESGLVTLLELEGMTEKSPEQAFAATRANNPLVFFDTVTRNHQRTVGKLIWKFCIEQPDTVFAVGSSGLEYAITDYLQTMNALDRGVEPAPLDRNFPTVVMSGSASPVTAEQIDWALSNGFEGHHLDTKRLIDPDLGSAEKQSAVQTALDSLTDGQSVVLYSASGPQDERIDRTKHHAKELGLEDAEIGARLGREQGAILREIITSVGSVRVCIAGGDTSGHVARSLDIYALEMLTPVAPGGPLCRTHSNDERFDGLEIALKGGQVGQQDYFGLIQEGGKHA